MGNSGSGARRRLGDAIQSKVFQRSLPDPLTTEELAIVNKLADKEQERLQNLPTFEALNAKDTDLGQRLTKLHASVTDRAPGQAPSASTSSPGGPSSSFPTIRTHQQQQSRGPHRGAQGARRSVTADDERGRLPSFILRDVLEHQNAAAASGQQFDVDGAAKSAGADPRLLRQLLEHCCIPQVGKVGSFGHQYAFARPPLWWRGEVSGQTFVSEPWAKMIKKSAPAAEKAAALGPQEQDLAPAGALPAAAPGVFAEPREGRGGGTEARG